MLIITPSCCCRHIGGMQGWRTRLVQGQGALMWAKQC
jgi:hypothetical protein